jgi:hypothetical protein
MNVIIALAAGLLGGGAGFFAGIGVGLLLVDIVAISSFEGSSGYFTVLIGLVGSVIGFFTAVILTLRYRGSYYRGFGAIAGRTDQACKCRAFSWRRPAHAVRDPVAGRCARAEPQRYRYRIACRLAARRSAA